MISVISVYSDEKTLREVLLEGLQRQNVDFELITVDNTGNKHRSAAEALNDAARGATGKYLMFVHQDVGVSSDSFLETLEARLNELPDVGVAGGAGRSKDGETRGYALGPSSKAPWEMVDPVHQVREPEVVQILDESILIVPKSVFNRMEFDADTFDGWHCYGADYCLSVRQLGLKVYTLPMPAYHASAGTNVEGLLKYQRRLYQKHRNNHRRIYTTSGELSGWNLRLMALTEALRSLYLKIFPGWDTILKRELSDCQTLLDLGCGWNSPVRSCGIPFSVGIECHEPYLDASRKRNTHSQYVLGDMRSIEFHPKSVDAVVAMNLPDRMGKADEQVLIKRMETWARKRVVVVTPNEQSCQDRPIGEGETGWKVRQLRKLGFRVYGINGWSRLGGPDSAAKSSLHSSLVWRILLDLSQKVAYHCPSVAFQLLAVKEVCANK